MNFFEMNNLRPCKIYTFCIALIIEKLYIQPGKENFVVVQGDENSKSLILLSSGRRNQRRLHFQGRGICSEEEIGLSYKVRFVRDIHSRDNGMYQCMWSHKFQAC